jgi:biopolymer transport protein ExbB/TolQ
MNAVLEAMGITIYALQAATALFGLFVGIMVVRKVAQKRMSRGMAAQYLDEVGAKLKHRDFDGVVELSDAPPYWTKAMPQLVIVALANRQIGPTKLKGLLSEKFERDVLSELDYQLSWITTVVKTAPMLGLLGTVQGMILAFAKISTASQTGGVDPSALANDISFALLTTMYGLAIAIPMTVIGNWAQVRIGRMTDEVQEQTTEFLSDLDVAMRS